MGGKEILIQRYPNVAKTNWRPSLLISNGADTIPPSLSNSHNRMIDRKA